MKIVHICLCGPFSDGFTYQENLMTKYQKKHGFDVTIITSQWSWNQSGKIEQVDCSKYVNNDEVQVIRLKIKNNKTIDYKFRRFLDLYRTVEEETPNILFIHDIQFLDMTVLTKYIKKHREVKVFVDNHNDFINSARNFASRYILHGMIWKAKVKKIEPYVTRFYGVLPARVDFLHKVYDLPLAKCELLVMGADDEEVHRASNQEAITQVRRRYGITENDFLIVTGGKINEFREQTLLLMQAVAESSSSNIKLIVFGVFSEYLKQKAVNLCDGKKVIYVGWANTSMAYDLFSAADLVAFPGAHSVYWEEAVGVGKPLLCRDWKGMHHIDIGGNVEFITEDSVDFIKSKMLSIAQDKKKYSKMLLAANSNRKKEFLYSEIALKAIEHIN